MKLRLILSAIVILSAACNTGLGPVVPETAKERKMLGLLQKFDRWDYDGNGELNQKELTAGLISRGSTYSPVYVMDFYDTNGDKNITLREAQDAYSRSDDLGKKPE